MTATKVVGAPFQQVSVHAMKITSDVTVLTKLAQETVERTEGVT